MTAKAARHPSAGTATWTSSPLTASRNRPGGSAAHRSAAAGPRPEANPMVAASMASASRWTHRCRTVAVRAAGSAPARLDGHDEPDADRRAVGEHAVERLGGLHPGDVVEVGEEAAHAVDEDVDVGQLPARLRPRRLPVVELGAEVAEEAVLALPLGGADDGDDVAQTGEDREVAGAVVEDEQLQPIGPGGPGAGPGDGEQRGGGAAAGDAEDGQVALARAPPGDRLGLAVGVVRDPDHRARFVGVALGVDQPGIVEGEDEGKGFGPGAARRRGPGGGEGRGARVDQSFEVGGSLARPRERRGIGAGPEGERQQLQRRTAPAGASGGQGGLDGEHLAGPEAHAGSARTAPRQARSGGPVDDVGRIGGVLDRAGRCGGWRWP